jgi:hypothetical protein
MQEYIFYNNVDGKIFYVRKIKSDSKANEILACNQSFPMSYKKLSEVTGNFTSDREQKIDLTTTPISIVKTVSRKMISINVEVKEQRNRRLTASDWTQSVDSPLSDSKKTEWQTYRQALRDLDYASLTEGQTVTWPTEPS